MQRFSTFSISASALAAGAALSVVGCASHRATVDPAALAALHADLRVVHGETTWVTHGRGYELVARARTDLAALQPGLDRAATFFAQVYPHDSLAPIVAAVRRVSAPDKPFVAAAPLPADAKGAVVELVLVDPKTLEEERKREQDSPFGRDVDGAPGDSAAPAVHAWLSARASQLTGMHVDSTQLKSHRDVSGSRVPVWAVEMANFAGNAGKIDEFTKLLATHVESLISLDKFFAMDRPVMDVASGGRRGGRAPGGESPPGGGRGGAGATGGMGGGRGGMGGRGGARGGGMGGGRSGGGPSSSASRGGSAPQGPALFTAQSAVLAKYFARTGYDLLGDLIDARLTGKSIDEVFAKHNVNVHEFDADWRSWVTQRADALNHS